MAVLHAILEMFIDGSHITKSISDKGCLKMLKFIGGEMLVKLISQAYWKLLSYYWNLCLLIPYTFFLIHSVYSTVFHCEQPLTNLFPFSLVWCHRIQPSLSASSAFKFSVAFPIVLQEFFSLAWSTVLMSRTGGSTRPCNILAAGGKRGLVKLIHPRVNLAFGEFRASRRAISIMRFSPRNASFLFSESNKPLIH